MITVSFGLYSPKSDRDQGSRGEGPPLSADHRWCRAWPEGGRHGERGGTGQGDRGAEGWRRWDVRHSVRRLRLGAVNDVSAVHRDLEIGPETAAPRLHDGLLAGPQLREP